MTPATATRNERRPTRVGSAVAVLAVAGAAGLVADGSESVLALAVEVIGLSAFASGVTVRRRGFPGIGLVVTLAGAGIVLVAFRLALVLPAGIPERAVLLVGMLGTGTVAQGLLLLRSRWSRRVVTLGTAVVGASALAAGALRETPTVTLFAAVAATMVAWDAAEQAIGLGEQVGPDADTATVELLHIASSTAVGTTAVGVAVGAASVDGVDLPIGGVVLLLTAAVVLVLALYR